MSNDYTRKTDRLNRSYDTNNRARVGNPWYLLASAILFQAAVDCQNWTPEIEKPVYGFNDSIRYRRFAKLREFINSDWVDELLCWQTAVKPEAYCEELVKRLTTGKKVEISSVYGVFMK